MIWTEIRRIIGHQFACWAYSVLPSITVNDIDEKLTLGKYIILCGEHSRIERARREYEERQVH